MTSEFPWSFNTLRPRQNGRHFADDTFKRIFLNENVRIPIKISMKFVPKGPINNIPALVQIMAWRRPGDNHYLNQWWLVYWRIYASLGLNELTSHISKVSVIKFVNVRISVFYLHLRIMVACDGLYLFLMHRGGCVICFPFRFTNRG